MPEFNEIKISRILNPTSIDLGEYVINPFMGCEFSCLYCYVRSNKVMLKKKRLWGEFVDIRVNIPELLEKEILTKKPKQVLLGSTTECFQPIERRYRLTGKILEILNHYKINYVILTRSPFILDYLSLLKEGFCKKIYFTVNRFDNGLKKRLEPKSPAFEARDNAVNVLFNDGLAVVPYFSPLIPWVSDIHDIFIRFKNIGVIEFECLNFRLHNINDIITKIIEVFPALKMQYGNMLKDELFYAQTWKNIEDEIKNQAKTLKKRYNIYIHSFGDYFKNRYGV